MGTTTLSHAPTLGQILMTQGVVTAQQLENAIQEQKRTKLRLGETLVATGACTDSDIAHALARQLGMTVAKLDPESVDRKALKSLGEEYLRARCCLPMRGDQGVLRLAVADPFDVETSEAVQRKLDAPVILEVSTRSAIQGILDTVGDQSDRVEQLFAGARERAQAAKPGTAEIEEISADEIVRAFVGQGIRRGSADIHVEPEDDLLRVRYRIDGLLQPGTMIPKEMMNAVIARLKLLAKLDISERRLPQDGRASLSIDGRNYDLRVSILPTVKGECCVMRILDSSRALIPEEGMGLRVPVRDFLREVIKRPHGLFLVTGPTGSGKSTTLYGMLARVNALELKVVTVEDPVEYRLPLIRQVQVHSEIGMTFAAGLRSILRQDPDVVLLGEVRDTETAQIAVRASMTGHFVLSTLHTNSAVGAVTRMVDIGIDPFLLTSTLCGVLAQRLVRKLCCRCKKEYEATTDEIRRFHEKIRPSIKTLWKAPGCASCNGVGYRGRMAIHEALRISHDFKRLIIKKATEEELLAQAIEDGFETLHIDGQYKAVEGSTTLDEVERVAIED